MKIIINHSSMTPIYEQLCNQIKNMIKTESLREGDVLPSVRSLSKELKISALTVKKAYDFLEQENFTITVHGKGTFVNASNKEFLAEEQRKEIENDFYNTIQKGKRYDLSDDELKEIFTIMLED
ncbi:MAG: GntR family transcriptional regulator [Suipraeoptans sp.]